MAIDSIKIKCEQGEAHKHKKTIVTVADRRPDATWREAIMTFGKGAGRTYSERIFAPDDPRPEADKAYRTRWAFVCPLCRFPLSIRGERLDIILESQRLAGADSIDLRRLAAILM
jgi:hypothetical protein